VIAPEIYHDVKAEDAPRTVERMPKAYLAHRASPKESFQAFTRRHDVHALRSLIDSSSGACPDRKTGPHPGSSPGQAFSGTCASEAAE
jgi:hypothetical protein